MTEPQSRPSRRERQAAFERRLRQGVLLASLPRQGGIDRIEMRLYGGQNVDLLHWTRHGVRPGDPSERCANRVRLTIADLEEALTLARAAVRAVGVDALATSSRSGWSPTSGSSSP